MTAKMRIFRGPRKIVFIIGGILLLGGTTGAFAVFVGKDALLGNNVEHNDGLACTSVKTFKVKKNNRLWVRTFIKTEPSDGLTRVRTALRVANAIYNKQKPDLVQVVVLDQNGPELRSDMRGRAVGADVVFVPDPAALPDLAMTDTFTAKYVDGSANPEGQFYGEKIQVPIDQVKHLLAALSNDHDCIDPAAVDAKPDAVDATDAKAPADEGHGNAKPAEAEAPSGAHEATDSGKGDADTGLDMVAEPGLIDRLKAMIFGDTKPTMTAATPQDSDAKVAERSGSSQEPAVKAH